MTWTSDLLGINNVYAGGVLAPPERDSINFVAGAGISVSASDNPVTLRTDVTISTSPLLPPGGAVNDLIAWGGAAWVPTNSITVASLALTASAAVLTAALGAVGLTFHESLIPSISQDACTSDAVTHNLTVSPQAPFASATGANRTPGNLVVSLAAPTNGGTTEGGLIVKRAGSFRAQLGSYDAATNVALWMGPALVPGSSNFVVLSNGAYLTLNAPSGASSIFFDRAGANILTLAGAGLIWSDNYTAPGMSQATRVSDAATNALTISAQSAFASATGTNRNGADLLLLPGAQASGGTVGLVQVGGPGGSDYRMKVGFQSAPTSHGAIFFLPAATAPTGTNFHFLGNTADCYLNAPTGTINFLVGNFGLMTLSGTATLAFGPTITVPLITQNQRTGDNAAFDISIVAQQASTSATGTNRNGGNLLLKGGVKTSGGAEGMVRVYCGATHNCDFTLTAGFPALIFDSAGGGNVMVGDPTSDVAPKNITVSGANAYSGATTNINGAACELYGGARKSGSAGLSGPIRAILNNTETAIEVAEVASGRRAVVLCRFANITTTQLPASTGDGVVYVGNAATAPTANSVSGGLLYSEGGAGKWRGTGGTTTTFGPAEPHCPRCGRDYALEWQNEQRNEHLAICVACLTVVLERSGVAIEDYAITHRLAA